VTDKKFPGNPTRSYRSRAALKVVGEIAEWTRLTPEALQSWRERLTALPSNKRAKSSTDAPPYASCAFFALKLRRTITASRPG
jgi:hypothetical protein